MVSTGRCNGNDSLKWNKQIHLTKRHSRERTPMMAGNSQHRCQLHLAVVARYEMMNLEQKRNTFYYYAYTYHSINQRWCFYSDANLIANWRRSGTSSRLHYPGVSKFGHIIPSEYALLYPLTVRAMSKFQQGEGGRLPMYHLP